MIKNGFLLISVVFLLMACGESRYRKAKTDEQVIVDSISELWGTYRGLYSYNGPESNEFQNCEDMEIYWVQDMTGDLPERYNDLKPESFQTVWIEAKGEVLPPAKEGIASEYSRLFVVHEVYTMVISNCQGEQITEPRIDEENMAPVTPDGRIQFIPGTTSTRIHGMISGHETKEYILRASAGQTLTIAFRASNRYAYYAIRNENKMIFDSSAETENQPVIRLPDNADYKIIVFLMRNEARREGQADFTLDVEII